jgi:nucleoside-diphosphate-sugar epimerase
MIQRSDHIPSVAPEWTVLQKNDPILITGAAGFIGSRVVESLLRRGFTAIRCFARPSSDLGRLESLLRRPEYAGCIQILRGNLLSRQDCAAAVEDVAGIFHLAAARGEKSVPDAYMNSVVTTRNLLEAAVQHQSLRRFVSISSFAVYANADRPAARPLDESCPIESQPALRGDAYSFVKVKQDEIVLEYAKKFGIPCVLVRPGYVYGGGNEAISGRVGIGSFGIFLHLGGSNALPLTFVDNCAEAIVLAGLTKGIEGETFNVVDDDLPSSRRFLRLYKRHVRRFHSIYIPHAVSYCLCWLWEGYSAWSEGQLPPVYNRRSWGAYWRRTRYSNAKIKRLLGWTPAVTTQDGLTRYFAACREKFQRA